MCHKPFGRGLRFHALAGHDGDVAALEGHGDQVEDMGDGALMEVEAGSVRGEIPAPDPLRGDVRVGPGKQQPR